MYRIKLISFERGHRKTILNLLNDSDCLYGTRSGSHKVIHAQSVSIVYGCKNNKTIEKHRQHDNVRKKRGDKTKDVNKHR